MTSAQIIYLIAVAIYLVFFLLFSRFFIWKHYADRVYWRPRPRLSLPGLVRLAAERGATLPFISVMVPARNEADVIEKTIEHMAALEYPADRFEMVVVTDQKELLEREEQRKAVVGGALGFFVGGVIARGGREELIQSLVTAAVARLGLRCWVRADARYSQLVPEDPRRDLSWDRLESLVAEIADDLVTAKGRLSLEKLFRRLRRALPGRDDGHIERVFPNYLGLALPVAATVFGLSWRHGERYTEQLLARAAYAHHRVTRQILKTLVQGLSELMAAEIETLLARGQMRKFLGEVFDSRFPTTQQLVKASADRLAAAPGRPRLVHLDVPYDFDGRVGGECLGRSIPSTKGRALNFALTYLGEATEICGFYDAESRPDPKVLLYVAYRCLTEPTRPRIFQGPVFQVRNFYEMGPFCKIAALYQAIAHDWYLPSLLRKLPFIGGTNLYIERSLLMQIGGYDDSCLTEDLELGTRAYLRAGVWPEYLPYSSSEQTPATLKAFYRQRLRWGYGHLQVMDRIRAHEQAPAAQAHLIWRRLFVKGNVEWVLYQAATFVPPAVIVLYWLGAVDPKILPGEVRLGLHLFSLIYFFFTFYAYYRYGPYLDHTARPAGRAGQLRTLAQLFLLPLATFFFPVPYSSALVLKHLNRGPLDWVKTPRTKE
ncbi:MAG: glycosyltransferase [Bacillota bacterium]